MSRLASAAIVLVLALAAACAPSDPPPRSPFEDDGTVPPGSAGTPRPLPTFTADPGAPGATPAGPPTAPPTVDETAERERVTGEAISRLAEWTGAREVDIALQEMEGRDWPSACLGVPVPGVACAEVVTPGYRVTLSVLGQPQYVHTSRDGRYVWAPAFDAHRTVESVDLVTSTVTFEANTGPDEMGRVHRVVAGSRLDLPLADLQPGTRVHVAVSFSVPPELDAGVVVWLTLLD